MWFKKKEQKEPKFVFNYHNQMFVPASTLEKHIFSGNIEDNLGSFIIVSSYDKFGDRLRVDSSLDFLGSLSSRDYSLRFGDISNPVDNLLLKTQWFARIHHAEPISIFSYKNTEYELRMPHQIKNNLNSYDGIIRHDVNINSLWDAGPFQLDKLNQDRLLISPVSADDLDALIRSSYGSNIYERF